MDVRIKEFLPRWLKNAWVVNVGLKDNSFAMKIKIKRFDVSKFLDAISYSCQKSQRQRKANK